MCVCIVALPRCPLAAELADYMMPSAVVSAGVVHICNNLAEDMDESLSWYSEWLPGFKALAHLLHHDHLRQRLVAFCVMGSRFSGFVNMLKHGVPDPAKWRWGTVTATLSRILPLRAVLQGSWDATKFANGVGKDVKEMTDDEHKQLKIPLLTKTIRSNEWWSYSFMILRLNSFPGDFCSWAEGCPCHHWLRPLGLAARAATSDNARYTDLSMMLEVCRKRLGLPTGVGDGVSFGPCPLAGLRAVDFATGAVARYIEVLAESYLGLIMEYAAGINESFVETLLSDFNLGKAHAIAYLDEKLKFWKVFPWRLAALNIVPEADARLHAKEILNEFDAARDAPPEAHHRLANVLLKPGSAFRLQLEAFAGGQDLATLPLLARLVREFMFVPVAERSQEVGAPGHNPRKRVFTCMFTMASLV